MFYIAYNFVPMIYVPIMYVSYTTLSCYYTYLELFIYIHVPNHVHYYVPIFTTYLVPYKTMSRYYASHTQLRPETTHASYPNMSRHDTYDIQL